MSDILTKPQKYCGFADNFERCMRPIAGGYWCPLHPFAPVVEFTESRPQTDLRVSEAVPEAKTGVQSDSGAGIGLPEPSVTKQIEGNCVHCGKEVYLERDNWLKKEVWFHRYNDSQNCAPAYAEPVPTTAPETVTISLPALRATLFRVIDTEEWRFYNWNWANSDTADEEATEHRVKFADAVCDRLRQLARSGLRGRSDELQRN